jgi:hypothetical protein
LLLDSYFILNKNLCYYSYNFYYYSYLQINKQSTKYFYSLLSYRTSYIIVINFEKKRQDV